MSIKGSSKKLKIEFAFPVFIIAAVIATVLRTYQCLNIIEPDTGFFKEENISLLYFYGLLAIAAVVIFAICYLAKKVPLSTLPEGKNIPLAVSSVLFAITFFADAIMQAKESLFKFEITDPEVLIHHGTGISFLVKSGILPKGLEAIFAILCAVYFIIFAVGFFSGSLKIQNRKVLAIMPVFWATMRMIQRFTRTISIINVSDLLLELFMIAFMMMFFLSFAQLASNVNSRHVVNKVFAYGLIGAMFALVISVSRMIVLAVDPSLAVTTNPLEICDFGFAVFVIALCLVMLKMPTEDNVTLKQVEKLREEHKKEEANEEE